MINNITLTNYRNLKEFSTDLSNHTVIIAQNGAGKTNILESIYYAMYGTSFKSIDTNKDVIGPNEDFAKISIDLDTHKLESIISLSPKSTLKRIFKKNNKPSTLKKVKSDTVLIVFSPVSVDLVNGSAEIRRSDLDLFISSLDSNYLNSLTRYNKVLKNKNALLKNIRDTNGNLDQLDYWNNELSRLASELVSSRIQTIYTLNSEVKKIFAQLYRFSKSFELIYKQFKEFDLNNYQQSLLDTFNENSQKEIIVGKTLYGPHKDDVEVLLDGKSVRFFGSRGQQRIATLLIKLSHMQHASKNNFNTVLLIDDIFSELDSEHRKRIAEFFVEYNQQLIITSADENEVPEILKKKAKVITL